MKRILSEKTIAAVLFVFALTFFVFAQQDAKKVEKMYKTPGNNVSTIIPAPQNTAATTTTTPASKVVTLSQSR
jgi:hypothetical protein